MVYHYLFKQLMFSASKKHLGFFGPDHLPLDQRLRICSSRFRKWASVNCVEYLGKEHAIKSIKEVLISIFLLVMFVQNFSIYNGGVSFECVSVPI